MYMDAARSMVPMSVVQSLPELQSRFATQRSAVATNGLYLRGLLRDLHIIDDEGAELKEAESRAQLDECVCA